MAHRIPNPLAAKLADHAWTELWSDDTATADTAALILVGLHGLRCAEAANLRRRNVDPNGSMEIRNAKQRPGARECRHIPLRPSLATKLFDMAQLPSGYVFHVPARPQTPHSRHALTRKVRTWCKRFVAIGYNMHDLRHTAATELWLQTKDIVAVMSFLGHHNLAVTHRYLNSQARIVENQLPFQPSWSTMR